MTCTAPDCTRPAHHGGLCHGHAYRKRHSLPMEPPLRTWGNPRRTLEEASLAHANAETDDEFERARNRLRMATVRYAHKLRRG
jgi:hypothetical protein